MSLALLFHYLLLNMFRMLIHPSSGACDLFDELLHGLYGSGSMRVGVATPTHVIVIAWVVWFWLDACWCCNTNTRRARTIQPMQ